MFQQIYKMLINGAKWLMDWSFGLTGNYGLAIILFTVLITIILYPLKHPQLRYSKISLALAPKLKEIQTKYKNDQQKMTDETLALWKKYNVNPAAGCLPTLISLPIFFAILAVMREIQFPEGPASSFLWIANIGQVDQLRILPILSGLSTYFQSKISGVGSDQSQKSMLYMFPLMMVWITWNAPAGLALYWAVSNILAIVQQYLANRLIKIPDLEEETVVEVKKGAAVKNEKP